MKVFILTRVGGWGLRPTLFHLVERLLRPLAFGRAYATHIFKVWRPHLSFHAFSLDIPERVGEVYYLLLCCSPQEHVLSHTTPTKTPFLYVDDGLC